MGLQLLFDHLYFSADGFFFLLGLLRTAQTSIKGLVKPIRLQVHIKIHSYAILHIYTHAPPHMHIIKTHHHTYTQAAHTHIQPHTSVYTHTHTHSHTLEVGNSPPNALPLPTHHPLTRTLHSICQKYFLSDLLVHVFLIAS